jgi:hypothetical protein
MSRIPSTYLSFSEYSFPLPHQTMTVYIISHKMLTSTLLLSKTLLLHCLCKYKPAAYLQCLINSKTEQSCEKGNRSHSFGHNDFSNTFKVNLCYVSYQLKLQQKNFQQIRMETHKCHPYFTLVTPSSHYY